jgi:hypothetical protein
MILVPLGHMHGLGRAWPCLPWQARRNGHIGSPFGTLSCIKSGLLLPKAILVVVFILSLELNSERWL